MEAKHKELITSNLSALVKAIRYDVMRPHLQELRIFPLTHLKRLDEKSNPSLDMFLEIQRRGPTAFRRLLTCLKLAGLNEALEILTKKQDMDPLFNNSGSVLTEKHPLNIPMVQSLDLTDSPLQPHQISVLEASMFRGEDDITYKMSSSPRGFCMIIDNEDYDDLPPRRGSHVDCECLTQLFRQLGFWVCVKRNLSRPNFEFEVSNFAGDSMHAYMDMCVLCVLSHGENGTIICTNGEKVEIETMLNKFNNQSAPSLRGKPKFFLIQSCRGLDIDAGCTETDSPTNNTAPSLKRSHSGGPGENLADIQGSPVRLFQPLNNPFKLPRSPSYEDIIVSYATIPGFVAYRNNVKGSWFVQSLCKVFMEFCHVEDLVTLMNRVSQQLSTYGTIKGEKQMCETLLRGVKKHIYFNPGLADRNRVYTHPQLEAQQPRLNLVLVEDNPSKQNENNNNTKIDKKFEQAWREVL